MAALSPPRRATTLADVAAHVGVSTRTVSRVVNRQDGVSVPTIERVRAAIDELSYRPNLAARRLVTQRSQLVGLVLPRLDNPFFPSLAVGVQEACLERGKTVLLGQTLEDPGQQVTVVESLVSHGIDGLIILPVPDNTTDIAPALDAGIPVVTINSACHHDRVGQVRVAFEQGARAVAEHLRRLGHVRTAYVGNACDRFAPRRSAFVDRIRDLGLPRPLIAEADHPVIDAGLRATRRLLASGPDVTAVFAYNDLLAVGAMRALAEARIPVPGAMSVVGFDDVDLAAEVSPALTSVSVDRAELGRRAVELLARMADGAGGVRPKTVEVPVRLQLRQSSALAPTQQGFRLNVAERVSGPEPVVRRDRP